MDQELISLLTQLDAAINNLPLNPNLPVDKIRDLQNKRAQLDKKLSDFKVESDKRYANFKSNFIQEISKLNQLIAALINASAPK